MAYTYITNQTTSTIILPPSIGGAVLASGISITVAFDFDTVSAALTTAGLIGSVSLRTVPISSVVAISNIESPVTIVSIPGANIPSVDAFCRTRVSQPETLFDNHSTYGRNLLWWEELTAGSGSITFVAGSSNVLLSVGTGNTDRAVRQSKGYFPYQPGKSHLILFTGILGASKLYTTQRIGYFDDYNGVFFQMNGPLVNPSIMASDIFSGDTLSDNWTVDSYGGGTISVNAGAWSTGAINTHGIIEYTAIDWPNDQYSEITYGPKGSSYETDVIGPAVRMGSGGGYWATFYDDEWYLWAVDENGELYHQIAVIGGGINVGDKIRLSVSGTQLILTQNGTIVIQATDIVFSSGNAGIIGYNQSANPTQSQAQTISYWEGGSPGQTGGLGVVLRSTVNSATVDTVVPQALWNLDKLDGTGPSGLTVNPTFNQIHIIDLEWLGAGRVRFGFDFGVQQVYCHSLANANIVTGPYMQTACLPMRCEIFNTGTPDSASSLMQICSAVMTEGGDRNNPAIQFTASNGSSLKSVTTTTPLISIKPALTFGGFVNHIQNIIKKVSITTLTHTIFYQLIYNGTLGGSPSFGAVDTNSGMTYDVAASSISGGVVIDSGYITTSGKDLTELDWAQKLCFTIDMAGTIGDIITVVATSADGYGTEVGAAISWEERQ